MATSTKPTQKERSKNGPRAKPAMRRAPKTDASATARESPPRSRATAPAEFKTSMLSVRVKSQLKSEATKVFDEIGISLPEAVRVFLHRVVRDGGLPFRLEVPNAETAAALRASREGMTRTFATPEDLFDALEKGVR